MRRRTLIIGSAIAIGGGASFSLFGDGFGWETSRHKARDRSLPAGTLAREVVPRNQGVKRGIHLRTPRV
jgi:hypothetical protein